MSPSTALLSSSLCLLLLIGCGMPAEDKQDPWGVRSPALTKDTQDPKMRESKTRIDQLPPPSEAAAPTGTKGKPAGQFVRQEGVVGDVIPAWEYMVVSIAALSGGRTPGPRDYATVQDNLARFGEQGWELCILSGDMLVFKRRAPAW